VETWGAEALKAGGKEVGGAVAEAEAEVEAAVVLVLLFQGTWVLMDCQAL
jgi:hypothetical protein